MAKDKAKSNIQFNIFIQIIIIQIIASYPQFYDRWLFQMCLHHILASTEDILYLVE